MKHLIVILLTGVALNAQTHVSKSSRTSVTTEKLTIAHDASNAVSIQGCIAWIQATVAGTVSVEVGGAAATTTAVTPVPVSPGAAAAKAKAFSNSNVGAGTDVGFAYRFSANTPFPVNLKSIFLLTSASTQNFTVIVTLDASGDVKVAAYHAEGGGACYN
jgi:hypothetical protein